MCYNFVFYNLLSVLPLIVSIDSSKDPLAANGNYSFSCTSYGSYPPAVLSWWLDGVKISEQDTEVKQSVNLKNCNHFYYFQVTVLHNSNTTNSILNFIPNIGDTGKFLKCRAENLEMSASQIEDSWNLDINCNYYPDYLPTFSKLVFYRYSCRAANTSPNFGCR